MSSEQNSITEIVDHLHGLLEARQTPADMAITCLVSAAGEIALGMAVVRPDCKDAYIKLFNSTVEQVRKQLRKELKTRGL